MVKVTNAFNAVCSFGTRVITNYERVELPAHILLSVKAESQLTQEELIKTSRERDEFVNSMEKQHLDHKYAEYNLKEVNIQTDHVMLCNKKLVQATIEQMVALKIIELVIIFFIIVYVCWWYRCIGVYEMETAL